MELSEILEKLEKLTHNWLDEHYSPVEIVDDMVHGIDKTLVFDKNFDKIIVIIWNPKKTVYSIAVDDYIKATLSSLFKISEKQINNFITSWVLEKKKNPEF